MEDERNIPGAETSASQTREPRPRELWDWPLSQRTRWLAQSYSIVPRKRLSQHFLINDQAAERLADAVKELQPAGVVEIGGGLGALTVPLVRRVHDVIVYEIDVSLCKALAHVLSPVSRRAHVVCADFLQCDPRDQGAADGWCVVGNLPYQVTTPILEKIFTRPPRWAAALLMVQREFAQRMMASPGSKTYGSLSVFAQYYCSEITQIMELSPGSFWPAPEVHSVAVLLRLRRHPPKKVKHPEAFFQVVHGAFQHRRKTLLRALAESAPLGADIERLRKAIETAGLDPKQRPETLGLDEFAAVANALATLSE
ncbi:MAG: 16S rRNA (adenine(1518)-N(6)/adenine(1519)-N(6))-dimethyltransferase RsmA [Armatimonadetes bacterium]|nr:16S rRNA (adenine(1518)-N(6)/adenine(1519)-N(6))-dimethyltransferase RsmA [Armatimonadota bacterium]